MHRQPASFSGSNWQGEQLFADSNHLRRRRKRSVLHYGRWRKQDGQWNAERIGSVHEPAVVRDEIPAFAHILYGRAKRRTGLIYRSRDVLSRAAEGYDLISERRKTLRQFRKVRPSLGNPGSVLATAMQPYGGQFTPIKTAVANYVTYLSRDDRYR